MKKILNRFLRKDLNLKRYWWHRLISVLFYFFIFVFFVALVADYSQGDIFGVTEGLPKWKKVASVNERIKSDIKPIKELLRNEEKASDSYWGLNKQVTNYEKSILNDVYCSSELYNKFTEIQNERNIKTLYIRGLYGRNSISEDVFSKYIKENNIKCISVDSYTSIDKFNNYNIDKLYFLEPNKTYQDNWFIYEKSTIKTIAYLLALILITLLVTTISSILFVLFYHKVVLYIIFGSIKHKENNID